MKKNTIHILLSFFLLAIMLVGRVGLHVFHHHEFSAEHKSVAGLSINAVESEAADCALCKIDTFLVLYVEPVFLVVFFLLLTTPIFRSVIEEVQRFSIFSKGRGPPTFFIFSR